MNQQQQQQQQKAKGQVYEHEENELALLQVDRAQKFNLENGREVLLGIHGIQRVISDMGGIAKTRDTNSNNSKFNYKFRSIEDMYNVLTPLFVHFGLVLSSSLEQSRMIRIVTTKGDIMFKCFVLVRYTIMSIVDGSSVEGCFLGEGNDSGDKSSIKAQSQAQKAFYIQTFNIPTATYHQDLRAYHSPTLGQSTTNAPVDVAPYTQEPEASLQLKNEVDEYMRQHKEILVEVLKRRNLDIMTIRESELLQIYADFKQHVAQKAAKAQAKLAQQNEQHAQDLRYAQDAQYIQNSAHRH